jgi:hypothetical protein
MLYTEIILTNTQFVFQACTSEVKYTHARTQYYVGQDEYDDYGSITNRKA